MKYLADENVASRIVEWLRSLGHDVLYAAEECPGESDPAWLRRAEADRRLLVTSDKDFGELVFRDKLNSHGVVLLRLGDLSMDERLTRLNQTWPTVEAHPSGSFIVITTRRVRIRPLT